MLHILDQAACSATHMYTSKIFFSSFSVPLLGSLILFFFFFFGKVTHNYRNSHIASVKRHHLAQICHTVPFHTDTTPHTHYILPHTRWTSNYILFRHISCLMTVARLVWRIGAAACHSFLVWWAFLPVWVYPANRSMCATTPQNESSRVV